MSQNKLSSRVYALVKSAAAAAMLPVLFIYVMIAKPDYHLMNALSHVVVPVATAVGDVLTWPVRVVGRTAENIRDMSALRAENEELRAAVAAAQRTAVAAGIAMDENARLSHELGVARTMPTRTIIADVTSDNRAFHHNTVAINRGTTHGVRPAMAVVAFDGRLIGTVIDAGAKFARVRALGDADSNIAVRIAGTEVYGFVSGNGSATPRLEFLSQPEFIPKAGMKLVTSNIGGVLPADIAVGEIDSSGNGVIVANPTRDASVMVLEFNNGAEYK